MQVAIWKIVLENQQGVGTWNLATGDVQYRTWSDTAVRDLATAMLGGLTGNGPYVTNYNALIANGIQDILVDPPAVPEPATLVMSGAGLQMAALWKRARGAR